MINVIIKHSFTHLIKYLQIDFYCFNFFFLNLGIISVFLRFYYREAFINKMKKNKDCRKAVVVFLLFSGTVLMTLITPTYKLQIVKTKVNYRFLFKSQNFTTVKEGSVDFLLSIFVNVTEFFKEIDHHKWTKNADCSGIRDRIEPVLKSNTLVQMFFNHLLTNDLFVVIISGMHVLLKEFSNRQKHHIISFVFII